MSTEAAAEIVQTDSATVETPAVPELSTLSPAERQTWRTTGNLPKKQDSAPAKKEAAAPDSAPDKKSSDIASGSEPDSAQKPHLKTKEDSEKRWREILDENKSLKQKNEELERSRSAARETKQVSQPAAEVYQPLDEKDYFKQNPKGTYEDFVRAAARHEAKWEVRQEIAAENQRRAIAEAQTSLKSKIEAATKRYPDFQARVQPAVDSIMDDQQIPHQVKALINDSPAFADLLYVIGEPTALKDIISTAKTNPNAAVRKIVLMEQLIQSELSKTPEGKTDTKRDENGKFVSEKKEAPAPLSKAPKPPSEVGGRETAPNDAVETAVKANPGKLTASTKAAMDRQYAERHR